MKIVEVNGLGKAFGQLKAVNDVSFSVDKGEVFGLLGPNGAGKSTLISMLTTLLTPDYGDINIDGHNIKREMSEVKKTIGLVPQEIALYPTLTAEENLLFWGRMYGLGSKILKSSVEEALDIAGLKDRKKDRIETFSGGMKRRINIAAALLHKPKLLIMDEPTVGIDPQSRNHILETVLKLNKQGMTVIYTSHYMEEVEYLCSRVAIMDHGSIIAMGCKEELNQIINGRDTISIEAYNIHESLYDRLKGLEGVEGVTIDENNIKILAHDAETILARTISVIDGERCKIQSINIDEPNLENVFLHLTGRALRD